ncbi:hypothetical protein BCR36DRAFT_585240 [Piromyces finnis]|uniref:BAR-domain-containing protein n=1 Tax=Piromyces finnis TaxID=1754191 RepID=A0A1Y1V4E7_9FUNG|nr:hypothetical protein BCR36DRAFT_585240 [Piromyces finnis]|eukprot:ORX46421.1 hypothetical protein BCR36DRAFT_585240 [Piromyces finnis]
MKKIHQLKQWTNEKVGRAKKTEMDEDIKQLIQETDLQREYFERFQKTLGDYIHIYDKRVDTQEEKKIQPVNAIGLLTINFGTIFPNNSAFGQALLKYGEGHTKLSEVQTDFVNHTRRGFENYLNGFGAEMKNYSSLKKKFDHRRLDLDEIQSRVKKSSKEKPQLVQELRVSQDKYEESLDELTKKIFDLNNYNGKHLESLKEFCLSELEYHRNAVEILNNVYNSIVDLKEDDSVSYDTYASNLTSNPSNYDQGSSYRSYSRKSSYSSIQNSYDINRSRSNSSSFSPQSPIYESPSVKSSIISQASVPIPRQQTGQSSQRYIRQVRANFDFTAEASNELSMKAGDIINVIKEIDEGWWQGEATDGSGRSGIFPQNYTTEITPQVPINNSYVPVNTTSSYDNSVNEVTQSMADTNIGYSKPTSSGGHPTSVAAELQQRMATVGANRNASSVRQNTGDSSNSNNSVGVCSTCGCSDYALNVFKPPLCNNCFHNH